MKREPFLYQSACKECGVVLSYDKSDTYHHYYCPRCGALVYASGERFIRVIIMALSALIAFFPTLFMPILTLEMADQTVSTTLLGVVRQIFNEGNPAIGLMVGMTGMMIPLLMMTLLLLMLIPLHFRQRPLHLRALFQIYSSLRRWGMAEVYLISIPVSMIKLDTMGDLSIDPGFYLFFYFLICFYIAVLWFNPDDLWHGDALAH
ncbi:MAG: paraquat-inducible protein A [Campylobacterales bacterium]|nr:paraquat-inducible protein A [Campylobacterales bacterium]